MEQQMTREEITDFVKQLNEKEKNLILEELSKEYFILWVDKEYADARLDVELTNEEWKFLIDYTRDNAMNGCDFGDAITRFIDDAEPDNQLLYGIQQKQRS